MAGHTELRDQSIKVLELPPGLERSLLDKGIRLVGELEDKLKDESILDVDNIGVGRAARLEQAIHEAYGPAWKRLLLGAVRSNVLTYAAIFGLLIGVMSIGSTKFNSGEVSILLIVCAAAAAYECGRWISSPERDREGLLTVGRMRLLIVVFALMIGFVAQANGLDESQYLGGWITAQGGKVFLLGALFAGWEAIRQFQRAKRIRPWLRKQRAPANNRGVLERVRKLSPLVQAAIVAAVGSVIVAGIGELSEIIHELKGVSIPLL